MKTSLRKLLSLTLALLMVVSSFQGMFVFEAGAEEAPTGTNNGGAGGTVATVGEESSGGEDTPEATSEEGGSGFVNLYEPLFYQATVTSTIIGTSGAYLSGGQWSDTMVGKAVPVVEGDVIYFTNKVGASRTAFVPFDANGAKVTSVTVAPTELETFTSGGLNVGIYEYTVPAGVAYLAPEFQRSTTHHLIVKNYRFTVEEYTNYWDSYEPDAKYEKNENSALNGKNILFLGDAAMNAYNDWAGLSTGKGVPARVALLTGANVTNLATGAYNGSNAGLYETGYLVGSTTAAAQLTVSAQFDARTSDNYDAVVLWAGIHDLRNAKDRTLVADEAMNVVAKVRAALPNATIFVINGPTRVGNSNSGGQGNFYNDVKSRIDALGDKNVYCIDLYGNTALNAKITCFKSSAMPDGNHFSAEGYDIITPYIVDTMEKALAPIENLYYAHGLYLRPSEIALEYDVSGVTPSADVNDSLVYRYNRAASRAIPVKEGDVLYFVNYARSIDIMFKYDANGNFVGSVSGGDSANVNNAVVPKQIETFSYNGNMAVHSWVVPAGVSYVAMMADIENAANLMITNGKKFTSAEYIAYVESFSNDALTSVTLDEGSALAGKNILFLGDAAMGGVRDVYAPSAGKGLPGRIAIATGANVYNKAAGGSFSGMKTTEDGYLCGTTVATQFAGRDDTITYDAVVLWAGAHDARNEKNGGQVTTALASLVGEIRTALSDAKIFVINGPYRNNLNYGGRTYQAGIYSNVKSWCASNDVYCIDLVNNAEFNEVINVNSAKYIPDTLNFTSDGYDILTPYVLEVMEEAFTDRYDGEFVNLYSALFQYANPNVIKYVEGSTSAYASTGKWNDSFIGKVFEVAEGDVIYFSNKLGAEAKTVPLVPYDANGTKLTSVTVEIELLESFASGGIDVGIYRYVVPAGVTYLVPLLQRYTPNHLIIKNYRFTASEYTNYWSTYSADAKYEVDEDSALKGKKILFLGDAAMYAYEDAAGLSTGNGIPGRIALITGAKVTNLATGTINWNNAYVYETGYMYGAEANWVANRYEARDKSVEYDAVVLWAGIWDLRGGKDRTAVADEVMRMVSVIRTDLPKAKVFVVNGPVRQNNANSGGQNNFYADVKSRIEALADLNVYCIDLVNNEALQAELTYVASPAMPDGIHFSAEGYDILTPYFLEVMEKGMSARTDGEFTNLYYPRMLHTRPDLVRDNVVYKREYQIAGRVIPVEAGDVLYFLNKSANEPFFKYDADGNALSTTTGSGSYTSLVESLPVTEHGYFGWISGYSWYLYSVTIPEGVAYVAPSFTTDNYAKHFVTKNRIFTKAEYDAYWAAFDPYKDVTADENSVLNGKNILFLGDSVMSGVNDYYAPTTGAGLPGRIKLLTGASVTNLAYGAFVNRALSSSGYIVGGEGNTVAEQFANREDNTTEYDAVVLWAGIYDLAGGNGAWSTAVAAKKAIVAIRAELPDAKIFVIGGPKFNTTRDQEALFNTQLKNWIENGTTLDSAYVPSGVYYVDLYNNEELSTALNYAVGNYLPDGVNPTSDGYDIIAPYVIDAMEDAYVDRERHDGEAVNLYTPVMYLAQQGDYVKYIEGVTSSTDYAVYGKWNNSYLGAPIEVVAGDYIYYTNAIDATLAAFVAYDSTGAKITVDLTATQLESLTIGNTAHGIYRVIIPEGVAYLVPTLSKTGVEKELIFKNYSFTADDYTAYFAAYDADDKYELDADSAFNGKNILLLGDGTALGALDYAGLDAGRGIAGRIELLTGANVYNLAVGDYSGSSYIKETGGYILGSAEGDHVLGQFARRDAEVEYDIVLLWSGNRDLLNGTEWGGSDAEGTYQATIAAIEAIREELPEAKIFVINGPLRKENGFSRNRQLSYYKAVKQACLEMADEGVYCIDLINNTALQSELTYIVSAAMPDGIHLSSIGYDILTPYVIEEMEKGMSYTLPENLYYALMKHRRPNTSRIEYANGATPAIDVDDTVIYREYRYAGRAFSVKPGDVIYYTAAGTGDIWFRYDNNGNGLSQATTGAYGALTAVLTAEKVSDELLYSSGGNNFYVYKVTVPEGTYYMAPMHTTDNGTMHFISKNRSFTKAEYDAYWAAFDPYENITVDENSFLNGKNILFLGDSVMVGLNDYYAPTTGAGIPGRIALMTGASVTNLATGAWNGFKNPSVGYIVGGEGNTVAEQFANRADKTTEYDAVVLWAGIYDIIGGNGAWSTAVAVKNAVVAIRAELPDAKIFVVNGPKYGTTADQEALFNTQLKTWLDGNSTLDSVWVPDDVYCIDLYNNEDLANEIMYMTSKYLPDGINPTSDGYDIITPYVVDVMEIYMDPDYVPPVVEPIENLYTPIFQYAEPNSSIFESTSDSDLLYVTIGQWGTWNSSWVGKHFAVAEGDVIYFTNKLEATTTPLVPYDADGMKLTDVTVEATLINSLTAGGINVGIYSYEVPAGVAYLVPLIQKDTTQHIITKNRSFTSAEYTKYWESYDANAKYEKNEDSNLAGKNILFLGDATMYGYMDSAGLSTGNGLPGRIALITGASVTNLATGSINWDNAQLYETGYLYGDASNNSKKTVIAQFEGRTSDEYDAVVLWAGIWDLRGGKGLANSVTAVTDAVSAIRTALPNAKIFVINGPTRADNSNSRGNQAAYYENVTAACDALNDDNVFCIDLVNNEALNSELTYIKSTAMPNGVYLSVEGYDIVTPYVLEDMEYYMDPNYVPEPDETEPEETEPEETEPEETDPPETEPEETEPEEPELPLENLYYPLMKHTAPSYTVLEYGDGIVANDRGSGSSIPTDIVRYREWQVSGRAFAVEAGDVLYYIDKESGSADNFFKYDANGNSLTTISGSGGYTSAVGTLAVTDHGYWGWIGSYGWHLYSVTIPEAAEGEAQIAYVAPALTTDNMDRHFISKNRSFTKDEWTAYWDEFDKNANTGLTYDETSYLNGKNVLFLGDPTMYGINDYWAPSTGRGIPGRVALATGANVTNLAASDFVSFKAPEIGFTVGDGNTVANQFANRADTTTVYDAVVIWAGIHDARYGKSNGDVTYPAFLSLVADIEAAYSEAKIFVISGPYRDTNYNGNELQGGLHNRFSAWGAESETDNHYCIDIYSSQEIKDALNYASSKYLPDGINPTSDGYDILAPYVIEAMEAAYAPAEPDETEPEETEPEETEPEETEPEETEPEETEPEEPVLHLENLYYPLMKHRRPNTSRIEYADGAETSTTLDDTVIYREYRFAGRAFPVKPGDVIYYTGTGTGDIWFRYDENGIGLSEATTGAYGALTAVLTATQGEQLFSVNGTKFYLCSVVVPEGTYYMAPIITTDNGTKHFISKNRSFTKAEYDAYWASFNTDANITKTPNSNLAGADILFLGDGTMAGVNDYYAPTTGKGIPGRIALGTGANVYNLASGDFDGFSNADTGFLLGTTVAMQYAERNKEITYDAVVIWAGIHENRYGGERNNDNTFAAFKEIAETIMADLPDAKIFVITGPKRDANSTADELQPGLRNRIFNWCETTDNAYCIDLYNNAELAEELMYTTSKYLPDGINPTSDGYDIIYPYVLEVMEKEMEHKHDTDKIFFLDDGVYFEFDTCSVCADWPAKADKSISYIVRNKLEDVNDGFGTITVGEEKNYWFSTDMAINGLTKDGVVLSIAGNALLTIEGGVLKAGDKAIASVDTVDTFQITVEFTERTEGVNYDLYVNGSKIGKGTLNSAFAITLGDPAFGSYVRFINNKAVVLAYTSAPVVPEYTKDTTLKTCYHVAEDFADAKLVKGKLVFDCAICGERAYIATAEATLADAIANRTVKLNDKVTVFELNTNEIDALGAETLLLGLERGANADILGLLYADADGNLFIKNANGENVALTTYGGAAISILGAQKKISVVYDDHRATVRYYVNETLVYAGGVAAVNLPIENAAFAEIEGEDKLVISEAVISSDYVVHASSASSVFKYVGFQENSISGQIRILSGIDALWYDSVGYEMKMYDADDNLTKTVIRNTKNVYELVGAEDKDVYAGFYGFEYFSPLVISDVSAINHDTYKGYTLVIEPFAMIGDVSYYGETVTILITEGGYRILKDVEIRIATGNLGDFTGNTDPYTDPAIQQATLAGLNADLIATQEDRNTVKGSSDLPEDVVYPENFTSVAREKGGDYNYKAYLSTYTLNDAKAVNFDFAKYGLDKESSTAPGHMISEFISHKYFYYANIVVNDIKIHFINIHVDWRDTETRRAQFENILRYIDEQGFEYVIILGDYNPDDCVAYVNEDGKVAYKGLSSSSTHEEDLEMFTNRPAGKLSFVAVNAGKFGTFNTILDPSSSSKDINPSACDNILVSENLKVKSVEKIAVDWMNDHAFIVADIVIPANKSALADGPELSENGVDTLLGISRAGESIEIPVSEDTFIYNGSSFFNSSDRKNKVYGTNGVIELYDPTSTYLHRVGYVKFDVSSLVGVEFSSVFAEFNVSGYEDNYADGKIDIYGATNGWSESTLTYNKRGEVTQGALLSSVIFSGPGVIRFDVTDYVRAAIDAGETVVSFMLENDNSMGAHEYKLDTKESSGKAPVLKANTGKSFSTYINYTGDASENPWQVAMNDVTAWNEKWATLKTKDNEAELLNYDQYGEFTDSVKAARLESGRDNFASLPTRLLSTLSNYTYNANEADLYNDYGGYTANGTIGEATGYYYTEYINGRWWTVDPEGYPFYRTAMVEVRGGVSPTQKANVLAEHGSLEVWAESATARLSKLGFNSTGAWSDIELLSAVETPLAQTTLLNVLTDYTRKTGVNITTGGSVTLVGGIMPVFDPAFAKFSDEKVASVVTPYVDDPNIYGWMSDNELPDTYLMLDRSLASDYTDARYFYTYATAWTFMYLKTGKATVSLADVTDELRAEYKAMVYDKYFQVVTASLAKYDTNHQYMGCRFLPENYKCEEVMRVAGQYCDVISVNYYGAWTPDAQRIYNMQKWSGKPFIVTEWYAMGEDADEALTNMSGAGFIVRTQEDRAKFYQNYALGLLEFEGCVGFDWFKMWDNDPTDTAGNAADSSNVNGNKGIYSTSYEEYTALVDAMSLINNNVHSLIAFFDARK